MSAGNQPPVPSQSAAAADQSTSLMKESLRFQEVTVEYIKTNDFAPRPDRKYSPRAIYKPTSRHGKGYQFPGSMAVSNRFDLQPARRSVTGRLVLHKLSIIVMS